LIRSRSPARAAPARSSLPASNVPPLSPLSALNAARTGERDAATARPSPTHAVNGLFAGSECHQIKSPRFAFRQNRVPLETVMYSRSAPAAGAAVSVPPIRSFQRIFPEAGSRQSRVPSARLT
jgi:hypothetical protein